MSNLYRYSELAVRDLKHMYSDIPCDSSVDVRLDVSHRRNIIARAGNEHREENIVLRR